MKVTFERVIPDEKSSFCTIHNNSPISEFKWEYHYHPEIELVCILPGAEQGTLVIIKVITPTEIWC